jgi:hypothetical protein
VIDCAYQVAKCEGIRAGLFRGFSSTLLRDAPGTAVWFASYEYFCHLMIPVHGSKSDLNSLQVMCAGGLAGMAYCISFFPADVVKSKQQTGAQMSSFFETFRTIVKCGGVRGLYRGLGISVLRAAPANGACFGVYEWCSRLIDKYCYCHHLQCL